MAGRAGRRCRLRQRQVSGGLDRSAGRRGVVAADRVEGRRRDTSRVTELRAVGGR